MKLIVAKFGSSGEKIIKLENKDGCRLEVSNYGAAVAIRWLVPNPLKQLHNIVLGSERLVDYFGKAAYFGATIGPSSRPNYPREVPRSRGNLLLKSK